jgi:hypothetical protein
MKALLPILLLPAGLLFSPAARARTITVTSLRELARYAAQSGNTIRLKPGLYKVADYLTQDSIASRLRHKSYQYLVFSGNDNRFELQGVQLEVDTRLREQLRHPIHTSEFVVSGSGNTFAGLTITCVGNGLSPGGAVWQVAGPGNTVRGFTLWVQGSFPYGYGDLFGKGGPDVIRHQKHSGFLITGSNTRVYNTTLHMRSFGHGFYMQKSAANIYFENCRVEGETRTTDQVLRETSGPAFDVQFRTWTANRQGRYVVTPGYAKSLCEDGFRTYGDIRNVRFKNCTAQNTRGGFELRAALGSRLEHCTTRGTERAYWVGNNAVVKHCRGDAANGPLLFVEGSNARVELEVLPAATDRTVHSLATVLGSNNVVTLTARQPRPAPLPILVGYTPPLHGEAMSPYSEAACTGLRLTNKTTMPVTIGAQAAAGIITSRGTVLENRGTSMEVNGPAAAR